MLSAKGMIAFAIAGITAIFLSSVVPVHAADKPYVCTPAQTEAGECLPLVKNNNPFSGAQSIEVTMEKETSDEPVRIDTGSIGSVPADVLDRFVDHSRNPQPPVMYTDFDISKHLEPWIDIMITKLAIWTYDREQERYKQAELLGMPPDFGGWLMNSLGMFILLCGLIGVVIVYYIWIDHRKRKAV